VCGSRQLRELLINRCRHFIFTTALPSAIGLWWRQAIDEVRQAEDRRLRLHESAAMFRAELARWDIAIRGSSYIVPVVLGDDALAKEVSQRLQQAGWNIRAIRPPSVPVGSARLRISIHADHDRSTVLAAAGAVAQILFEMGARNVSEGVPR
jgi:8-amino-7-oxononanoate synthase